MTSDTTVPQTVTVTEEQRGLILSALHDKLVDTERYLSGYIATDGPGPLDKCCEGHLARYEQRRDAQVALKGQQDAIDATIKLFSVQHTDTDDTH